MNRIALKRPTTDLPPTVMEDLILDILRLRRNAADIGLHRVVASIDYAYYEALTALREKPKSSNVSHPKLLSTICASSAVNEETEIL